MKTQTRKIDYSLWARLPKLNLIEGAMLINDIDPEEYNSWLFQWGDINNSEKRIKAKNDYQILYRHFNNQWESSIFPVDTIAKHTPLEVAQAILKLKSCHSENDFINAINDVDNETEEDESDLTYRERHNLLMGVGVMAQIIAKSAPKFQRGTKPNSQQIADEVKRTAQELGIIGDVELDSFNKTISQALSHLKNAQSR